MKKLTLILSMMLALIGFNANAAMYIVGNNPFGDWHTYAGVEMTDNGNGVYTYVTDQIGSTVWFVFADSLTTGTSDDWNTFNSNYRYGPLTSGEAIQPGVEYTTQKSTNGSVSYSFAGALGQSYQFTFDTNTMKFKVEGYVPEPEFNSFTVVGNNEDIFGTIWNPAILPFRLLTPWSTKWLPTTTPTTPTTGVRLPMAKIRITTSRRAVPTT